MKVLLTLLLIFAGSVSAFSQTKNSNNDIAEYKGKIILMMKYLEETLSFIGNPGNTPQEKDIIFKDSYAKIFVDNKVQIEDDLDENRMMPIYKDVQAYLKDIDFFFDSIAFSFDIKDIETKTNDKGETFFKVIINRNMEGVNILGNNVKNTQQRFIEINVDPNKKDLKIASIYTTKPNNKEEIRNWWILMSPAWKSYFGKDIIVNDSVMLKDVFNIADDYLIRYVHKDTIIPDTLMVFATDTVPASYSFLYNNITPDTIFVVQKNQPTVVYDTIYTDTKPLNNYINNILKTTEVNISGNEEIRDLEPLEKLSELSYLDCSNTIVKELFPIRNLNKLKTLNISNTYIDDISDLRYVNTITTFIADNTRIDSINTLALFENLEKLSLNNTNITDLSTLSECIKLETLYLNGTKISDLNDIKGLNNLHDLDVSNTAISNLDSLYNLKALQILNIDSTIVQDLSPLSDINSLNVLYCSNTGISDLMPLANNKFLTKIYCDKTNIDAEKVNLFKEKRPFTLVIFDTESLNEWWKDLAQHWKATLAEQCNTSITPTTEELHNIINIKSLRIDNRFQDILPVIRLTNLEHIDLSGSLVIDINPLYGHYKLETVVLDNTMVTDLTPLSRSTNIKKISIQNTNIQDLSPLYNLNNLNMVFAENSKVTDDQVFNLRQKQPKATVFYQGDKLKTWWNNLDATWRDIFRQHVSCDAQPSEMQLQEIANLESIIVEPTFTINSIEPLTKLPFLKKVVINDNYIQDLTPLQFNTLLEEISFNGNPVSDIMPLSTLTNLKKLNLQNTEIAELTALENMLNLISLNISGTLVKNLKPISNLTALEDISITNTPIKSIIPLEGIMSLKHITAYKTKIKAKSIETFRNARNDINILYY